VDSLIYLPIAAFVGWLLYAFAIRNPVARTHSTTATCAACNGVIELTALECRHCGAAIAPARRRRKRAPADDAA
jgi:hypothetical protein